MASHSRNWLSLCSGIGGLDLALRLADSGNRTVCYVEREAYCVSILAKRMQEKWLDSAPVWSDLTTFDGKPWSGFVDGIVAGFPCQPISRAGALKGVNDDRWIWHHIERIICEVQPRWLFLENVATILSAGNSPVIQAVLGTLASFGFNAEWDLFSAEEVGATHQRKRWFCLGYTHAEGLQRRRDAVSEGSHQGASWPPGPEDGDAWGTVLASHPHLSPATEPGVCCMADGVPVVVDQSRTDQLRGLGNAVVPLQAAYACRTLWRRMSEQP